jgi:membrane-associated phospholipid phosphatase
MFKTTINIQPYDISRLMPIIMFIYIVIHSKLFKTGIIRHIIGYILNNFTNNILKKYFFDPILGTKNFPFIGTGTRPPLANSCGLIRDDLLIRIRKLLSFEQKIPKLSYGFPSGYSQNAGYLFAYTYDNEFNNFNFKKFKNIKNIKNLKYLEFNLLNILNSFVLVISLYTAYTRIKLRCNTTQQVIFGFIIGILFYYIYNFILDTYSFKLSIKKNKKPDKKKDKKKLDNIE